MALRRPKSVTAEALSAELVDAKVEYETTKNSVLTKAEDRRVAVRSTIGDLEVEDDDLTAIIEEAK